VTLGTSMTLTPMTRAPAEQVPDRPASRSNAADLAATSEDEQAVSMAIAGQEVHSEHALESMTIHDRSIDMRYQYGISIWDIGHHWDIDGYVNIMVSIGSS